MLGLILAVLYFCFLVCGGTQLCKYDQVNMYRNSKYSNISDNRSLYCINFANPSRFSQINVNYKIRARLKGEISELQLLLLLTAVFPFVNKEEQIRSHCKVVLFVCVEVLRPSQPNGVMSSAVSLPNHTFTGQA